MIMIEEASFLGGNLSNGISEMMAEDTGIAEMTEMINIPLNVEKENEIEIEIEIERITVLLKRGEESITDRIVLLKTVEIHLIDRASCEHTENTVDLFCIFQSPFIHRYTFNETITHLLTRIPKMKVPPTVSSRGKVESLSKLKAASEEMVMKKLVNL
jgi:hypothetical protein